MVAIFSTLLLGEQPLTIFGDGEQTRDYVYVGDVVRANMLVTDATLPPASVIDDRAFNVGTGIETTVNELADLLMEAAGRKVQVHHAEERPGELRHSCLDASRLRARGWSPEVAFGDGLGRTYRHIAAQMENDL